MGCIQTKSSMNSPPQGLEKLKLEHGYVVRRGGGGRPVNQQPLGKNSSKLFRQQVNYSSNNGSKKNNVEGGRSGRGGSDNGGGGGGCSREGKLIAREGEREGGGGGNVSQRSSSSRKVGGEELVDGWPKWLIDNIPREALAGLVPKSAEAYDKLDKVGQGTYSNVYKARERDTGKIVALKKVHFDTSVSESVIFMAREIIILQKLDHPNVIKLEGLATSRMQYSLYLVFDFMPSDLSRIISRPHEKLTEPQIKFYMQQLLSGLEHCHERGILHRDIKGSNLLIDKQGMLKIADFGLANYFHPNQKRPLTNRVVTLWYRAPELLLGTTDYGVGIDLWSAGCLLAEMFVGRPILPGRTEVEQLHRIFKLCGSPSEDYWKKLKLSTSFRPPQPYKPSLLETFRDFPSSSLKLLTMLLDLDPTYRGSASSALQSEFFSTSPLACDISGLPVIYKEEDQPTQTSEQRKSRASKMKNRSRTNRRRKTDQGTAKSKGDSGSSKEDQEKIAEPNFQGPEMGSSTGSTSSGVKPISHEESSPPSMSPIVRSHRKRPLRTEVHPNATKNIKNPPSLPASVTSTTNINKGNNSMNRLTRDHRSFSTIDFRKLDQVMKSKRYALDE